MPKEHELTDFQKGEILALKPHFSHAEIGLQLHIPRQTITDFIERSKERQSIENIPRPGRPRKTSTMTDRWLVHNAESDTHVPFQELKNILNIDIGVRTLRRRLREAGIRKWRAVKRPLLTPEHAKKRRNWAKIHLHWTVEDWRRVIWSDESIVKRNSDSGTVWVFRHQTKSEKYAAKNIQGKQKFDNLSALVWGCFIGDKLGPIVFVDGTVKQETYIGILEEHFLPFLDTLHSENPEMPLEFVQDNARPHVAAKTRDWFKVVAAKYNLKIMEWPPNSPDMNLIEQLWAHLKYELYRRFPDTASLNGSAEYIKSTLRQRLHTVWWDIGVDLLNHLVNSMPKRVEALARGHGWYTEY